MSVGMVFDLTKEQREIVDFSTQGKSFKIAAFAGSGKTSTLGEVAKKLSGKRGLYIAFNKAIATDASGKFPPNVICKTFHSLAWAGTPKWLTERTKIHWGRSSKEKLVENYKICDDLIFYISDMDGNDKRSIFLMEPLLQAKMMIRIVNNFCKTGLDEINDELVVNSLRKSLKLSLDKSIEGEDISALRRLAVNYWEHIVSKDVVEDKFIYRVSHDVYLKYWSMSNPKINNTDFILCDEAQDLDPVMLQILSKQKIQMIFVGDRNQQIYEWRGAINAMSSLELPEYSLTKSFRFGNSVAFVANVFLRALGCKSDLVGFEKINDQVCIGHLLGSNKKWKDSLGNDIDFGGKSLDEDADAYIYRTNAGAMARVVLLSQNGRQPRLEAKVEEIKQAVEDAKKLHEGKPNAINSESDFYGFANWPTLKQYVEDNESCALAPFVKLVERVGLEAIEKAVDISLRQSRPDCVVSTAHKAKGLEWEKVYLGGDFRYKIGNPSGRLIASKEELRLLYVCVTRAKLMADFSEISEILEAILEDPQYEFSLTKGLVQQKIVDEKIKENIPKNMVQLKKKDEFLIEKLGEKLYGLTREPSLLEAFSSMEEILFYIDENAFKNVDFELWSKAKKSRYFPDFSLLYRDWIFEKIQLMANDFFESEFHIELGDGEDFTPLIVGIGYESPLDLQKFKKFFRKK